MVHYVQVSVRVAEGQVEVSRHGDAGRRVARVDMGLAVQLQRDMHVLSVAPLLRITVTLQDELVSGIHLDLVYLEQSLMLESGIMHFFHQSVSHPSGWPCWPHRVPSRCAGHESCWQSYLDTWDAPGGTQMSALLWQMAGHR